MPVNKHTSSYLNAAYLRMVAAVEALTPPAFDTCPTHEQFREAAKHLADFGAAADAYVHAVMREASTNATVHISTSDRLTVVSDALNDQGLLGDLRMHADDLEQQVEFA